MSEFDDRVDIIKESAFNEAAKKMGRFDRLQGLLNEININLRAFNPDYGVYNFEVKFDVINSLVLELSDKIDDTDEKDCHTLRDAIDKYMKKNPIVEEDNDVRTGSKYVSEVIEESHFSILKIFLRKYETKVRKLIGKHGYSSPDKEGGKLF